LFYERLGRAQIGKTPPKIDLSFCDNSQSMAHLNFAQSVKVHYPAAHFEVQFIIGDDKLDDVGIFTLVCDRPPARWLAHIMSARALNAIRVTCGMNTGNLAIFAAIRRAS
jgi:hypothetical protein